MKKIGILTFHNAYNFGAVLQAYALKEYLQKNSNCTVEIVNYKNEQIEKEKSRWKSLFNNNVIKELARKLVDLSLIKEVCGYSLPLVPNQISGWILSASDRTIIAKFLSVAENGVYSVANKFSNLVGTFYGFFNLAWVETVSVHYNDSDRDEFIGDMMETVSNLFVSICVGIIAIMPFVFPVMVNQQYGNAYYQIPILLIAVNNDRALERFDSFKEMLKYQEISVTDAVRQPNLKGHSVIPKNVNAFWRDFQKKGIGYCISFYSPAGIPFRIKRKIKYIYSKVTRK